MSAAERVFLPRPAHACGVMLGQCDNGGSYRRSAPVIGGPVSGWAAPLMARWMTETVVPPAARLMLFHDATVRGAGVVTLPGDVVVRESLINSEGEARVADLQRAGRDRFRPAPGFSDGGAMPRGRYVLLKQQWDLNYGHWLIEGLPRLALLQGIVDLTTCRFIVSDPGGHGAEAGPMRAVIRDTLALFGIRSEQLLVTGGRPERYAELIYPPPLTVHPTIKAPLVVRVLERLAPRLRSAVGATRLFVRRLPTSRRALRNQDDVERILARRGYAAMTPGELDFATQAGAFVDARRVVGALGAECSNLAFAPRGVRFMGLAPEGMLDDFFYDLVSLKQGRYFCLHGRAETGETGMNTAFSVDLTAFETMLDRMENDAG